MLPSILASLKALQRVAVRLIPHRVCCAASRYRSERGRGPVGSIY